VFNVVQVFINVHVEGCSITMVDLPPACNARFEQLALMLPRFVEVYEFSLLGSRPD
jgi:hypothetical protein